MRRFLQQAFLLAIIAFSGNAIAQDCSELFISTYVEGSNSNRALEIYNPTGENIDLSEYSIARFSNGSATANDQYTVQLSEEQFWLAPGETFTAVVDKRDKEAECLDFPLWYGRFEMGQLTDSDTGEPIVDSLGNPVIGILYEEVDCGGFYPIHGDQYDYVEDLDLRGKADIFLTPVYDENRTMYWNGNDAVGLVKGTSVAADLSNVVDAVGVIGENPEDLQEPAEFYPANGWVNAETGFVMTRDRTLVRKAGVKKGVVQSAANGDTYDASEWVSLPRNVFDVLGAHECDCLTTGINDINANVNINLFPNPASNNFVVVESEKQIRSIDLLTVSGHGLIHQVANGTQTQVELEEIPTGLYMIQITFEDRSKALRKLTVLK